jgi:methylmalonyl-CoA mutase C-terminal domain/subunit
MSPEANGPIRCLLGMLGADVHSNGVRTLARRLRDRGVEVVYIGEHNTVRGMVETAAAEDVDVVGVSFWNPGYLHATRALVEELASAGLDDVTVMVGGLIHADDVPELQALGVDGVFGPGSDVEDVIGFMNQTRKATA